MTDITLHPSVPTTTTIPRKKLSLCNFLIHQIISDKNTHLMFAVLLLASSVDFICTRGCRCNYATTQHPHLMLLHDEDDADVQVC